MGLNHRRCDKYQKLDYLKNKDEKVELLIIAVLHKCFFFSLSLSLTAGVFLSAVCSTQLVKAALQMLSDIWKGNKICVFLGVHKVGWKMWLPKQQHNTGVCLSDDIISAQ